MNNIIKACLASLEITFVVSLNYHYMNERNNIMLMPYYICQHKFMWWSLEFHCCLKCRYSFDWYVYWVYAQWFVTIRVLSDNKIFVEGIFNLNIRNKYLSGWNCFFQQNSVKVISFIVHVRKRRALAVVAWLYKQ